MTFKEFVDVLVGFGNYIIIPFILAFAFLMFIWGVFKYFFVEAENEDSREKGRQFVLWGVIGFAIFFSLWGIVNVLLSTFGIAPE